MFHTHSFESTIFKEWKNTINQLHLAHRLELNRSRNDYHWRQVNDAHLQDQFLIYIDDEASLCESAAIIPLTKKTSYGSF